MTDYRSKAEIFVTSFLDYVEKHDILDEFDKRTQKMVRSPGVEALVKEASQVFPARVKIGKKETDKLTPEQIDVAVTESPNVLDRRDVFSRKIQSNGAARGLLERVMEGDTEAMALAAEFLQAEKGEKQFYVPPEN